MPQRPRTSILERVSVGTRRQETEERKKNSCLNMSMNAAQNTLTGAGYYLFVPNPAGVCTSDLQCTEEWNDLPVECSRGSCQCVDDQCWIYTYHKNGFLSNIAYTCGTCGQLGSQCHGDYNCDPPGYCAIDNFCHCTEGEHRGDVCFVSKGNYLTQFLIACVFIVLFFTAAAMIYQTFWNIRHNRRVCWCRCYSFSRRRRRRRQNSRQHRAHSRSRLVKTPAYTAQQRIYQNFHQRNDSEPTSEEEYTDEENIGEEEEDGNDAENGSSSTLMNMDEARKIDERNLQKQNIELKTFSLKIEPEENATAVEDVTGMTDYYNEHSHL